MLLKLQYSKEGVIPLLYHFKGMINSSSLLKVKGENSMEEYELFTIKPSLRQYYGKTVKKDTFFDEYTEDKKVHQVLKDLVLITEIKRETEFKGVKSTENSVLSQELPEGIVLIWNENDGYIIPDREVYKLSDLKEEIIQIEEIYKGAGE